MRIALYNLEPKYKNLALEKLRKYYTDLGHEVEDYFPLDYNRYETIYCSSIFDYTKKDNLPPNILKGGSGFDLTTELPPEIDVVNPHLNFGFTSRGCIRKCKFCIVPKKEGYVRATGDLLDLWDGKAKDIIVFDNNILALPEHFEMVCKQARENKLRLDFNQGLDYRLLTPELIEIMKSISHVPYRFAFDSIKYATGIQEAITLLADNGINRSDWYVLVGFDSTIEEDLARLNLLRELGQRAYVQIYSKPDIPRDRRLIAISEWANQRHIYYGYTFEQFINHPDKRSYRKFFVKGDLPMDSFERWQEEPAIKL